MIYRIAGNLISINEQRVIIETGGIYYEINLPRSVSSRISVKENHPLELTIFHYLNLDKTRAIPVMIGFLEELEREFFEKFISVSGIGPKAALKAFDRPTAEIAQAIEEGDDNFLTGLSGIGRQKAKTIIAHLQGKVGKFALIKNGCKTPGARVNKEIAEEAKEVLKRLQYTSKEAEAMIKTALSSKPEIKDIEELLNEIYRQKR